MSGSIQTAGQEMKFVLYGCDDASFVEDSISTGKKRLVTESGEIPFATCDQDVQKLFSKDYTKKQRNRSILDKVGSSRNFDPRIYLENYEESISHRKESSLRNFKGSGDILAHLVSDTERGISPTQKTEDFEIEIENDVTANPK